MKLSIITINWNNALGLEKTIQSVVGQTYSNIEYIIIDGASNDGSIDVIKKYEKKISYWISEPDKGIYNAMNKGMQVATGEYCLFLNSGDKLLSANILSEILNNYKFNAGIITCNLLKIGKKKSYVNAKDSVFFADFIFSNPIPHPSTFIKRELIQKHPYDESYKVAGDYVFFFEMLVVEGATYQHIPVALSVFYEDGISSQNGNPIGKEEGKKLLSIYISPNIVEQLKNSSPQEVKDLINARNLLRPRYYRIVYVLFKILYKIQSIVSGVSDKLYFIKHRNNI